MAAAQAKADGKCPTDLKTGEWEKRIAAWQSVNKTGSGARQFPAELILGTESVLARMVWEIEHKVDSPLRSAEILSKRAFTATGRINELSKTDASKTLSLDVLPTQRGGLAEWRVGEKEIEVRGCWAFIDALEAFK